jgi:AGCS family alanine or glycine:cation symporter
VYFGSQPKPPANRSVRFGMDPIAVAVRRRCNNTPAISLQPRRDRRVSTLKSSWLNLFVTETWIMSPSILNSLDAGFTAAVNLLASILFADLGTGMPFIVLWLIAGAVFFTIRMKLINVLGFRHALRVIRGDYDDSRDPGEVTHFQALTSALSATIGLGNIAGVTLAVSAGGAGAVFWMMLAGFFGMTSKFVECTLSQLYRRVRADGRVSGGPMVYLSDGLAELGWPRFGRILGGTFALLCVGGCLGGGNMFQANQSFQLIAATVGEVSGTDISGLAPWYGLLMMALVGAVIIGGIRRIGRTTSRIVPAMCGIYIAASLFVILSHWDQVPSLLMRIVMEAFGGDAIAGGLVGVLVIGVQRAVFSNEAGIGSAAIAHAAAKTDEPVREGIVALIGPFIDTIVICLMTALVVLITGVHDDPQYAGVEGAALTSKAFASTISWFPAVLSVSVFLFAYSTMISWSYYGQSCWEHLFGSRSVVVFKMLYLGCIFIGSVVNLGSVLTFSDIMILCMAFPNILGALLLSGRVRLALDSYWQRYRSGAMRPVTQRAADPAALWTVGKSRA